MKGKSLPGDFYEIQYMAKEQPLMFIVVWAITIFAWGIFAAQVILGIRVGNNPAPDYAIWLIMLLFGIAFPFLMFSLRLETSVSDTEFCYRYFPAHLKWRVVNRDDIMKAEFAEYSGLREFGGWGIRGNRRGRAYTVAGKYGVWITLKNGKEILIGSKRAEELEKALTNREV